MIDSVSVFFPDQDIDAGHLSDFVQRSEDRFTAQLGTLRVTRRKGGVCVVGSWPRYLLGNNAEYLERDRLLEGIASFERDSGLDAEASRVYQLEIGATLAVTKTPREYISGWEAYPRMRKDTYNYGMTVMFKNKARSLTGYDKRAQMKGLGLPAYFEGHGALRIEYRQKRKVAALFGRRISLADLADPLVRGVMLDAWSRNYFQIVKRGAHSLSIPTGTPRDFERGLASIAVRELGYEGLRCYVDSRARGGECSRTNASRIRSTLRELTQDLAYGPPDELSLELDERIRDFIRTAS